MTNDQQTTEYEYGEADVGLHVDYNAGNANMAERLASMIEEWDEKLATDLRDGAKAYHDGDGDAQGKAWGDDMGSFDEALAVLQEHTAPGLVWDLDTEGLFLAAAVPEEPEEPVPATGRVPMALTAENVKAVITDCLYRDEEVPTHQAPADSVKAEGVVRVFVFHPARLKSHEQDIVDMLNGLDPKFKEGWTFLNGCMTKDDHQWGEQANVECLFALGVAVGKGEWLLKELGAALPGGVPYYKVRV